MKPPSGEANLSGSVIETLIREALASLTEASESTDVEVWVQVEEAFRFLLQQPKK
jgi:hypothetical protein